MLTLMLSTIVFSLLGVFSSVNSMVASMEYVRTKNISVTTFNTAIKQRITLESMLKCGELCMYTESIKNGQVCNAFHFDDNGICELALISTLEETVEGQEKEIFVSSSALPFLPQQCKGGEHCCHRSRSALCTEGQGDCNHDEDCAGNLVCGNNNCLSFPQNVGLKWDAQDDCCEKPCTADRPCDEGGLCTSNSECMNGLLCGKSCTDTTAFPRTIFTNNTEAHGLTSSDKCCYRKCNKDYYRCNNNENMCLDNSDCNSGLYCKKDVDVPYCADINECALGICGKEYGNATCSNSVGSYSCSCKSGYTNFVEWSGCREINECVENSSPCSATFTCIDEPAGSYTCICPSGYYQHPSYGCLRNDVSFEFIPNSKNFYEARQFCQGLGGDLAYPINVAEYDYFSTQKGWLGIWDEPKEGTWTSVGSASPYMRWRTSEPNGGTTENCANNDGTYGYVDVRCTNRNNFWCAYNN